MTLKEVLDKIKKLHGDSLTLCVETYRGSQIKAKFIHKDYDREWWVKPTFVFQGKTHPDVGIKRRAKEQSLTLEEFKERLVRIHGNLVTVDESTYVDTHTVCRFFQKGIGEFFAYPNHVYVRGDSHPGDKEEKKKRISLKKYGVEHASQNAEAKTKRNKTIEEKYGVKNLSQADSVKEKKKKTNLKNRGVDHPSKSPEVREKVRQTSLLRYGFEYAIQDPGIALKIARSANRASIKFHWKTNEELVCVGSYEAKTVDYLNANQINFDWQPKTFKMPDGKTYRPDLYLSDLNVWVEIKGWMRPDAQIKWDWLKSEYPNSELWNQKKLKEMGIL